MPRSLPPPSPDARDKRDGVISYESFFGAMGRRPPGAGGGGDGASLFMTHHVGRNGSTPDCRSSSAATAGGPVAMAEQRSGDADLPAVNAVGDDNAGGHDCCKGNDGNGDKDDADCTDNNSNNSILEDDMEYNCEMVCLIAKTAEMTTANLLPTHRLYCYFYFAIVTVYIWSFHVPVLGYRGKIIKPTVFTQIVE